MAYTVLIVDDEKLSRSYIRAMIVESRPDVNIMEADSAESALMILAGGGVDVLFLDVLMPGTDGFGLIDNLEHRGFELVFITAYNQFAIQAIKQGAADYLLKPIKKSDFMLMLKTVLERRAKKLREAVYIRDLEKENNRLQQERSSAPEENGHMRSIYTGSLLTDNDWSTFRTAFDTMHPGFLVRLREKFPGLTQAEIRLVALSKLHLTTKEMAGMLGISPETVRQTRWRLRKKLELPEAEDLIAIINAV